jgi:phosphoribosyl 1,2-cyclic phosphodiesterase
MNRKIYPYRLTFVRHDDARCLVYLNEEVIDNYVPEEDSMREATPEPITAYAYTGPEKDGGTLIEAASSDRDSLINGIIRTKYSQSEEDAIKTHRLIALSGDGDETDSDKYAAEWQEFLQFRTDAIAAVDKWLDVTE